MMNLVNLQKFVFPVIICILWCPQPEFAYVLNNFRIGAPESTTPLHLFCSRTPQVARGIAGIRCSSTAKLAQNPRLDGLRKLPRVFPGPEILARALKRASFVKEDTTVQNARTRCRKLAAERIGELSKELTKPLGEVLDGYKHVLARLQPFEKVVADLTVRSRELAGFGSLQENLEAVKGLRKNTSLKAKSYIAAAVNAETRKLAEDTMDLAFEEIRSLWMADGWILEQLMDIGKELKSVPMLDSDLPTVVLVGSPNVGKSSIVRAISTGTPEVNNYPFTTRGMTLGHILDGKTEEKLCQVMDTPGLLDRPDEERNEMELLTLASMQHIPSLVLFVIDFSGGSGDKSPIESQLTIREELIKRFGEHEWIDVISKADIPIPTDGPPLPSQALHISVATGTGIAELRRRILDSRTVRLGRFSDLAIYLNMAAI